MTWQPRLRLATTAAPPLSSPLFSQAAGVLVLFCFVTRTACRFIENPSSNYRIQIILQERTPIHLKAVEGHAVLTQVQFTIV